MHVLTEENLRFFDENGYVLVQNVVPQANLDALIKAMFDFLGMDPNDPDDWYRLPLTPGGMIELYQHQALWDNRQHPRLYQAFADLFRDEKLWVSIDRANIKPPFRPAHPEYDHKGFMHWDIDTAHLTETPFGVQGVLYLADTDADMGGFQCVPGHHRILEEWIATQPADRNTRVPDLTGLEIKPIVGKAGDLVIWNRRLIHGNGRNLSDKPRLAQYITMYPAREENEAAREDRIYRWRERLAPEATWVKGDPRHWEQEHSATAELTPLGRKLLGLDRW